MSSLLERLRIRRSKKSFLIDFWKPLRKYSSAPYNGGMGYSCGYLNRTVGQNYNYDPELEIPEFLRNHGLYGQLYTVSLTSCIVSNAITLERKISSGSIFISVTAGTTNSLSIGSDGRVGQGTINIAIVTDITIDDDAAMNLFMSVCEAKSQLLNDIGIMDPVTGRSAPGTSTDSVSLFVGNEEGRSKYGGRLSEVGKAASIMTYETLRKALERDCRDE